jgi:hypothetical protein
MKKLLTIFLISLMLLTFSNTAFGGFFGDIFKDIFGDDYEDMFKPKRGGVNNFRCKVEYTQLDLSTGLEKKIKHTEQIPMFEFVTGNSLLYLMAQYLTNNINIWLNESKRNFITDLTVINCKERRLYGSNIFPLFINENRWGEYEGCPDEYNAKLIDFLDRPKQWGYNVHKERLIRDYEDGCKDYVKGTFKESLGL